MLGNLQKQPSRTVGPTLNVSFETLGNCTNLSSLSHVSRHYFGRCSSERAKLVPLSYSSGRSTCYCDRLYDFSVTILRCYKNVYVNSFFFNTARPWNSLPAECFPLICNVNSFKSRVNGHC